MAIERRNIEKTVEIQEFFERERLEVSKDKKAKVLKQKQLLELPSKRIKALVGKEGEVPKCMVCLEEFIVNDRIRTLKCFHNFHKACIDKWLTSESGSCPVCKVIQKI